MKEKLKSRVVSAEEAAGIIRSGMTIAFGGYTNCGYPKKIASVLVKRKNAEEDLSLCIVASSMVGPEIDEALAGAGIMTRRVSLIESRAVAKLVNQGRLAYVEQQMSRLPLLLNRGDYGHIDVAVVEAVGFSEEGFLIPGPSVGLVPHFVQQADAVIVELNSSYPKLLNGMHDVFLPGMPPNRRPIPLNHTLHRFGDAFVRLDPEKIKFIVHSDIPDFVAEPKAQPEPTHRKIAENLLNFLEFAVKKLPGGRLPPLQTGFGGLTNAALKAFGESSFQDLEFFCGGTAEPVSELVYAGKAAGVTTGSLQITPRVKEWMAENPEAFRERVILRGTDTINSAETIARLGLIALNSAIEADIYGNVNSSHISGTTVVNGIGGGANFAQNAGLSVLMLPSEGKGGVISTIVPMATHTDIGEHDIDVIVTEWGVADLRGLDDVERADKIISCASPRYRPQLADYFRRAKAAGGHHPQLLDEAFCWHKRFKETGTMLL